MKIKKILFLYFFLVVQSLGSSPLAEQFGQVGYLELCDTNHGAKAFDDLYACFDELVEFLQANPTWAQKLFCAKERFIRSKDRNYYSTDFFGFYDESKREDRNQIAFYYSTHFHEFIRAHYPEFNKVPQLSCFMNACCQIQKPYAHVFEQAAADLELKHIFLDKSPPILLKVIKYFPDYYATRPHYDGTALSLFLDSTDNQSLLLCPYKSSFTVDDFSAPVRKFSRENNRNSMVLIPGTLLAEFSIYPTPHIVTRSGNVRYATIAFAMRPDHIPVKKEFSVLPTFKH